MPTPFHFEDRTAPVFAADGGPVATEARPVTRMRTAAQLPGLLAVPAAVGIGVGAVLRSRKAGVIAGGITAMVLAATRWQLARWFAPEPDYEVYRHIGEVEIRLYTPRIEARTRVDGDRLDVTLHEGFRRLHDYIAGANRGDQRLTMTTPILTSLGLGNPAVHTVALAMPPGRTMDTLPRPADGRVRLHHVPERRIAVLPFVGRGADTIEEHGRDLLQRVAAEGLIPIGAPVFACFDPPWTLPRLRRNEIWVELGP